jgi:membrane-associated phospholipid phosphatase
MLNKTFIVFITLLISQFTSAQKNPKFVSNSEIEQPFKVKFKLFPKANRVGWKSALAAPVILGSAGITLHLSVPRNPIGKQRIRDEVTHHFDRPNTKIDDRLRHLPAQLVLGMNLVGHRGKSALGDFGLLYIKSKGLLDFTVSHLKKSTQIERPDGSNYSSFPSSHTATAFMSATFLHLEYGHLSPWYSIAGYGAAATVGWLRMQKNKHWASDVLTGAGIGILIPNLVYLTHRYTLIPRLRKWSIMPTYSRKTVVISMTLKI